MFVHDIPLLPARHAGAPRRPGRSSPPFLLERLGANARPVCLADQILGLTDADDASMRSRRFRRRHVVVSFDRSRWNREDRARREPHHALGHATQEGVTHAGAPVSAEDDEADALVSRVADDLMRYAARQEGGFPACRLLLVDALICARQHGLRGGRV